MSDTPCERIRKMMQDADDNNVPAHHRPGLVMSLLRQFGDELAAMTARAELAERQVGPQWQPIETAPKDGKTRIMIADIRDGEILDMDYDAIYESERESWEMPAIYWIWTSANGRVEHPTHWAPLPIIPTTAEAAKGEA